MARYKHIDTSPRFLAVDLQRQLLPGTFEHAMNHLIDNELEQPLHAQRANEGGRAVETLLLGTQHREAGASRVCAVSGRLGDSVLVSAGIME